jgi:hypothetical protein
MSAELAKRASAAIAKKSPSALKKVAKKAPGKKAPGKKSAKAPGKKAPGKKEAKHSAHRESVLPAHNRAFHHLQRAAAVISLLESESGGDLRMLLEDGAARYRRAQKHAEGIAQALGLLRAAEHLAMAGLYAARASHRLDVAAPSPDDLGRLLDQVGVRMDELNPTQIPGRLPDMALELLHRAEAASDQDLHLAWELAMAADGICASLEALS